MALPAASLGASRSACTVTMYSFSPGPFEQGGAYSARRLTVFWPQVPTLRAPSGIAVTDGSMPHTTM